ncbi:hypothetical protein BX666DRAFT_1960548 [Dichotomocladium elegans]|nr:hypothetical protein BX666DRAFT_1960548 [Dichotomocladium elegans]
MAEEQPLVMPPTTVDSECSNGSSSNRQDLQRLKLNERNRAAAFKYRQKKKKWIEDQERRSKEVIARNQELRMLASSLRKEAMELRYELLELGECDCPLVQTYIQKSSAQLLSTSPTARSEAAASTVAEVLHKNISNQHQRPESPPPDLAIKPTTISLAQLHQDMPPPLPFFSAPSPPLIYGCQTFPLLAPWHSCQLDRDLYKKHCI